MSRLFSITLSAAIALGASAAAQAVDRGDPTRGAELAEAQCLQCHSADAIRGNREWPEIRGQYAEYLLQSLRDYKSGRRDNAIMRGQVEGLSLQDKRDLASWFSRQEGGLYTPRRP
ncbi:cytochrome c553 [Natronocella acetinitrilica]|uniref:Cytochrome c553 n=1 Tax=Natronocella acetinitrilica TaxID=414046 RepID=A0AAE3G3Z0_9GAMM|nr:c-type cytochrome [Natronocella acetinitrilica]MCP1674972.1 cytochrome c553 [Natronocella acetinitrilica]